MWPADGQAGRIEADLRMAELDLDAVIAIGKSALSGLGMERPREVKLVIEAARARFAGLDARNISTRLTLDAEGLAIERLSIGDFGDTSFVATGRMQTQPSPGGSITVDLDARDLNGIIALAEKFAPALADPLRRLAARQKTATLRASVSLDGSGAMATTGKIEPDRQDRRRAASMSPPAPPASARRSRSTDPGALAGTNVRIDGQLESDESGPLLDAARPRPDDRCRAARGATGRSAHRAARPRTAV